ELQGARILVFEDNPINAELLESRLQSWGCLVRLADRVPVGLRILEQHPVDLILMDLRMPQMDGFQATNLIRTHKNPAICRIPVIALTADFMAVENQNIRELGLDSVLLKPYDSQELYTIMSTLCRQDASRVSSPGAMRNDRGIRSKEGLICLNYLESECVGDADLLSKLVIMFKGNLLEFAGRMKLCLLQEDHAGIAEAAHKILSSLKLIQATFFLNLVEEIYREASEGGKIIRINSIYLKFLRHYPMLVKALECELEKRKHNGDES
ncbi:MAG: response regulator, partial [Robiginitalea sp.]